MSTLTPSSTVDPLELEHKESVFLASSKFAVVGASDKPSKWGAKIFKSLLDDKKDVVPVNINRTVVQGQKCLKSLSELSDPQHTAVCVILPPKGTLEVLKQAKDLGIPAIWLQPNTTDDTCMQYIRESGLESRCIYSVHPAAAIHTDRSEVDDGVDESDGSDISGPCNGLEGALETPSVIGDHIADLASKTVNAVATKVLPTKRKRPSQSEDDSAIKSLKSAITSTPSRRPTEQLTLTTEQKENAFLASPKFAVVGASNDTKKYGAKVFTRLRDQGYDVVPINFNETTVQGVAALKALSGLPDPAHTAISVVVPPKETLKILKAAKDLDIPHIWIQPKAADALVVQFIKDNGLEDRCIYTAQVPSDLKMQVDGPDPISGPCGLGESVLDAVDKVKGMVAEKAPCLLSRLHKAHVQVS